MKKFNKVSDYLCSELEHYIVLDTIGKYTIIFRGGTFEPWVAANNYHEESQVWDYGHYFKTLGDAVAYALTEEEPSKIISSAMDICSANDCGCVNVVLADLLNFGDEEVDAR